MERIASIRLFCVLFDKPENTVDVSKCLANLSSFSAKPCNRSTYMPRLEELTRSSLPRNVNSCLARMQVALMRSFKLFRFSFTLALWMLPLSSRCSSKPNRSLSFQKFLKQSGFECEWSSSHVCWGFVVVFLMSQYLVLVQTLAQVEKKRQGKQQRRFFEGQPHSQSFRVYQSVWKARVIFCPVVWSKPFSSGVVLIASTFDGKSSFTYAPFHCGRVLSAATCAFSLRFYFPSAKLNMSLTNIKL